MRVGVLSYPMLFQNEGGLQVQVRESIAYLRLQGIDIKLVDVLEDQLTEFDIVHVFAPTQGNYKIVEQARAKGCRVVVSGLLNRALVPSRGKQIKLVQLFSRILGRLSNYTVTTTYDTVKKAFSGADHVIALSEWERVTLNQVYQVSQDKITVIPNAVSSHFNQASAEFKAEETEFVFCPAQISSWKNQKTLIEALVGTGIKVVLAGPVPGSETAYLDECLGVHGVQVEYVGNLPRTDPQLAAYYAAAAAVVLVSRSESGPLVALEALGAGTPAVVTKYNGLDIQADGVCLISVDPFNKMEIRDTILKVLASRPQAAHCRALVEDLSWANIARQIAEVYQSVMTTRPGKVSES